MYEHWAFPPTEPSIGLASKAVFGVLTPDDVDSHGAAACTGFALRINILQSAGSNWISEAYRVRQIVDPRILHLVFNVYGPNGDSEDWFAMDSAIRKEVESAPYSLEIRTALLECYKDALRWSGHCSVILDNTITDRFCMIDTIYEIYRYYTHIPCAKFVRSHKSGRYVPIDEEEIAMYIRHANELERDLVNGLSKLSNDAEQVTEPIYMPSRWFSRATKEGLNPPLLRMAAKEHRLKKSKQLGTRWHHNIDEVCAVYQQYSGMIRMALDNAKKSEAKEPSAKN